MANRGGQETTGDATALLVMHYYTDALAGKAMHMEGLVSLLEERGPLG